MKIGITVFPTYGGSGIVGSELGRELADRGHEVHFISYELPTRLCKLSANLQFHEVEMFDYPLFEFPPYTLALASKIVEIAHIHQLDLMHMHYAIPHATAAYLARQITREERYLPFVTTLHGTDITLVGSRQSFLPVTKFSIEQSDAVTTISNYLAAETQRTFGFTDCEVIPNFINAQQYRRNENESLRQHLAPRNEKLLMHVSNFRPVKRITDCVRALAILKRQCNVPVRLIMCGDGPERANAELMATELGIANDVIFVGSVPNIPEYLSVADVFLLPSESESFGLAALEAMACEVPVIAANVGGLPEVVRDGVTGFLTPLADVNAIAQRAALLLNDPALQAKLGQQARQDAIQNFATEHVIPKYVDLYNRVIHSPKFL